MKPSQMVRSHKSKPRLLAEEVVGRGKVWSVMWDLAKDVVARAEIVC